MALTEQVVLDISRAQQQIDQLERQLGVLDQPIRIPVDVTSDDSVDRLRNDLRSAEGSVDGLNSELAQTDRELDQVGTSARRAGNELDDVGRRGGASLRGLTASAIGFAGALAAFQGVQILGRGLAAAIGDASDLEESLSKTNVVFGDLTGSIEEFASTAPAALGLSTAAALESTATFGNLFVALGLSQQAAAELAPDIVQLASDLASFNNIEVGEAVEKLRAGLVGEAEPLRVLGVNLTAAATATKAVELGLAATTTEVSEAAKVQARYALILEQTVTAQGDFARTADGIANTQRTLSAQFENLSASIGEALAPAFANLLTIVPPLVDAIERTLVPAIAGLGTALGNVDADDFITFLSTLPTAVDTAATQFSSAGQVFANSFQLFGAVASLNFDDIGSQFSQLTEDIEGFRGAGVANTALQNLIETLASGVDPATALESALKALGENVDGITLEGFEVLAEQLVSIAVAAGAAPGELRDLGDTILEFGEAAGFSAAGVEVLVDELLGPWGQAMAQASSGDIIASNLAVSLAEVGGAADDAAGPLGDAGEGFEEVVLGAEAAATAVRDAASALLELTNPAFAALNAQGNLTDAQTELAEAVAEFGASSPEAIDAALALAEAEIRLTDAAADLPGGLAAANEAIVALIDEGVVADETLQGVKDALDELDGLTSEARLNILIETFGSTTGGAFGIGPGFAEPPAGPVSDPDTRRGDVGRGDLALADVTVNINNPTTQDLNTDASRAAQTIGAVAGLRTGSQ